MNITSHSAQITASDSEGSCGVNINSRVGGYVADLEFWGKAVFVARRKGDAGLHILVAPGNRWLSDIEKEGFEIIGKLTEFPLPNSQ